MSEEERTQLEYVLWIDHTDRIISLKKAEGFERKDFLSHDEKIAYALEKSTDGYRIQ